MTILVRKNWTKTFLDIYEWYVQKKIKYNVQQNEEENYFEKWIHHLHDVSIVYFFCSMNQSSRAQQQQGAMHLFAPVAGRKSTSIPIHTILMPVRVELEIKKKKRDI